MDMPFNIHLDVVKKQEKRIDSNILQQVPRTVSRDINDSRSLGIHVRGIDTNNDSDINSGLY